MLWHIRIDPAPSIADSFGQRLAAQAVESGLAGTWSVQTSRGFLIEGDISRQQLDRVATEVLVDPVVETHTIEPTNTPANGAGSLIHVMPKPGVTDPEGASALELLQHLGYSVSNVRTIKTYRVKDRQTRFRDSSSACWPTTPSNEPSTARSLWTGLTLARLIASSASPCRSVNCAMKSSCT